MHRRTLLLAASTAGLAACSAPAPSAAPPKPAPPSGTPADASSAPAPAPATALPRALPPEVTNGPRDVPAVALTFHGQGDAGVVGRLLDALGRTRVTVLGVGVWVQQEPTLARRIVDAGHELGNHTMHHADIATMGEEQAYAEIDGCATALRSAAGSIGRWFRPSQTQHSTARIRAQAARAGYPTCLSYDVDSLDYTDPGAAAVVRTTLQHVRNGSIVSLHCGHPGTVEAIPALLAGLSDRGLRPVTVSELLA